MTTWKLVEILVNIMLTTGCIVATIVLVIALIMIIKLFIEALF